MSKTISISVYGKVQGVFFRQSTREKARELGITGRVSNERDGSVRIVATGSQEQLDQLVTWCRVGPPKARVANCVTEELPAKSFQDFTIERD
jgi:acylphosphatase